jgi:hypothetical protein
VMHDEDLRAHAFEVVVQWRAGALTVTRWLVFFARGGPAGFLIIPGELA